MGEIRDRRKWRRTLLGLYTVDGFVRRDEKSTPFLCESIVLEK